MDSNPYQSPDASNAHAYQAIKIKAYGFIPLTQNGYLLLQVVLAAAFVLILLGLRPVFAEPRHPLHIVDNYFWTIVVGVLLLEVAETMVMLSKFKKARQHQSESSAKSKN